ARSKPAEDRWSVVLVDAVTGIELVRRKLPPDRSRVTLSPDGRRLASLVSRRTAVELTAAGDFDEPAPALVVEDVRTGRLLLRVPTNLDCTAFSPDGRLVAVASEHESASLLRVWEVASGQLLREQSVARPVSRLLFTADGRGLVVDHPRQ